MGNMKANRKFVEGEEAVSAVIGVILMVAITVAIAATVYVYVSGMLPGPSGAQKTMGAIIHSTNTSGNFVTFKVTDVDAGIPWDELTCKYTNESGTETNSSARWGNVGNPGLTGTAGVGDHFWVNFSMAATGTTPNHDGTWTVDMVFKDTIIWTSAPVTV